MRFDAALAVAEVFGTETFSAAFWAAAALALERFDAAWVVAEVLGTETFFAAFWAAAALALERFEADAVSEVFWTWTVSAAGLERTRTLAAGATGALLGVLERDRAGLADRGVWDFVLPRGSLGLG